MQRRVLLGGSWVVISRVISRVTIVITYIRGLIAPLITTHEPPISGVYICFQANGITFGVKRGAARLARRTTDEQSQLGAFPGSSISTFDSPNCPINSIFLQISCSLLSTG